MEETPIYNIERQLLTKCMTQTIDLIHCTRVMDAIKKLTAAYDILELNIEIEKKYARSFDDNFFWDMGSIEDLKQIKSELFIFHNSDFDPILKYKSYDLNLHSLIKNVTYRFENL